MSFLSRLIAAATLALASTSALPAFATNYGVSLPDMVFPAERPATTRAEPLACAYTPHATSACALQADK
ncbi:hypothetical protein AQS8620_00302 [Aquimixticola soesokkakensis]|uniref:Uncharacterized protein n=1 Tax=Aquimixticola soesokkakensis TaxID=1519096 RepID=A0A1Y5RJ23_9RHOB|nr:hypothetical protein [Aquimixticola soesokkakensis]SLN16033.1 hypothetical protein AQS8620_00302 [Aquimixticola soesokkakensis]